jgi:hypothetical protein
MPEPDRSQPAHLQLLAVSWNFGWPIAAGVVLGHWIDEKLGTSPAATLLLGIGSMAASTWRLVTLSRREAAERRDEDVETGQSAAGHGLPSKSQRWDEEAGEWVEDDDDTGTGSP